MFASPFGEDIPIPDAQFWATPCNNFRPNLHSTREELSHDVDTTEAYDTGIKINNITPATGTFAYNQHATARPTGQADHHQFQSPFIGHTRHENDEEILFDRSGTSSSVGPSTPGCKRQYSSRSPEVMKLSPQSTTALSPASGSSVNWMADGTIAASPSSPISSGSVHVADPSGAPVSTSSTPSRNRRNRERNRVAAHKCRQKAKQSMSDLQTRERELSQQNRLLQEHAGSLRDEILDLKNEILRHSDCNSDIIQNYIAKAAREVN